MRESPVTLTGLSVGRAGTWLSRPIAPSLPPVIHGQPGFLALKLRKSSGCGDRAVARSMHDIASGLKHNYLISLSLLCSCELHPYLLSTTLPQPFSRWPSSRSSEWSRKQPSSSLAESIVLLRSLLIGCLASDSFSSMQSPRTLSGSK